jgi:large subunit ribosomal protein L25
MARRTHLSAEPREVGRKALLTELRRKGKVPAVLYGHGDPQPVALDVRPVEEFLRRHGGSALIDLTVNGDSTIAMFKQVEQHPISGKVRHLDILRVLMSDTISAHVPLHFTGGDEVEREGGVLTYQFSELAVTCRADHLPERIEVELGRLRPGDLIRIADLTIPEGVTATQGEDQVVVACSAPAVPADVSAELDAEAAMAGTEAQAAEAPAETS